MTTPSHSERSPNSGLSRPYWLRAFPGASVQASALALALLLGFGIGVTFQSDHDARILAGRAAPEQAFQSERLRQAAAPPTPESAGSGPGAPQAAASAPAAEKAAPQGPQAPETATAPQPTLAATEPPATPTPGEANPQLGLAPYAYVYRYEKDGEFAYRYKSGKFANVAAARSAAISECQAKGGRNCKFNFASAGLCIAIVRPPSGQYRVSTPEPDAAGASLNARAQCLQEHEFGLSHRQGPVSLIEVPPRRQIATFP